MARKPGTDARAGRRASARVARHLPKVGAGKERRPATRRAQKATQARKVKGRTQEGARRTGPVKAKAGYIPLGVPAAKWEKVFNERQRQRDKKAKATPPGLKKAMARASRKLRRIEAKAWHAHLLDAKPVASRRLAAAIAGRRPKTTFEWTEAKTIAVNELLLATIRKACTHLTIALRAYDKTWRR